LPPAAANPTSYVSKAHLLRSDQLRLCYPSKRCAGCLFLIPLARDGISRHVGSHALRNPRTDRLVTRPVRNDQQLLWHKAVLGQAGIAAVLGKLIKIQQRSSVIIGVSHNDSVTWVLTRPVPRQPHRCHRTTFTMVDFARRGHDPGYAHHRFFTRHGISRWLRTPGPPELMGRL